jgi:hypothetical protein
MRRLVIVVVVVAACSKKGAAPDDDEQSRMARALTLTQLGQIETALANAQHRAAHAELVPPMLELARERLAGASACSIALQEVANLGPGDQNLFERVVRLCKHDLPLAELQSSVAIVEAAKKSEACSCGVDLADDYALLERTAPGDPQVDDLAKRFSAVCGDGWHH